MLRGAKSGGNWCLKQISHFVTYCDMQSKGKDGGKSVEEEASGFPLSSWILPF